MSNLETINGKIVLFIAIPRTGSVSIIRHFGWKIKGHQGIVHYDQPRDFTFTFVRNPLDRLVSAFMHLKNGGMNAVDKRDYNVLLSKYNGSFTRFVMEGLASPDESKAILDQQHFRPQMWHIVNISKFDYIGRFEKYDESLLTLCHLLNITYIPLKKENKTDHSPYQEYYDDTMRKIVAERYKYDFELLNYTP